MNVYCLKLSHCIGLVLLLGLTACAAKASQASSLPEVVASAPPSPLPTSLSTAMPNTPAPFSEITSVPVTPLSSIHEPDFTSCISGYCLLSGHFLLNRPIAPPGNDRVEPTYLYGSTQHGEREIHHGVEFKNDLGTPVLAAAEGVVIVAGTDELEAYGPKNNFYGQLIVLEHDFAELDKPLYTLYAHLSHVAVHTGDKVKRGQMIGRVGMSGIALGYHLHFEVRSGQNTYENTRNPELWLKPSLDASNQPCGALSGRIVDLQGTPMRVARIVLHPLGISTSGLPITLETYDDQSMARTDLAINQRPEDMAIVPYTNPTLGRDDWYPEDFAMGNLTAGTYRLSFTAKIPYNLDIEILPNQLTYVLFQLDR